MNLKLKKHQESLFALLETLDQVETGAEIGVWRGHTCWWLLQQFPDIAELVGVDHYPEDYYIKVFDNLTVQDRKQEMLRLLGNKPYYKFFELPSTEAAKLFPDLHFDFVFLDGDHSFSATDADIRAWYPKVREGGVLCGHDYDGKGDHMRRNPFGVKRAVDGFALDRGLEVEVHPSTIWAIRK